MSCASDAVSRSNLAALTTHDSIHVAHEGHMIPTLEAEGKNAPLSGIVGWHLSIVMPEIMHGGPLGQIQSLDGSLLKDLADSGIW